MLPPVTLPLHLPATCMWQVMRTYEREMQKPLRNLVGGELVRALLIQASRAQAVCSASL